MIDSSKFNISQKTSHSDSLSWEVKNFGIFILVFIFLIYIISFLYLGFDRSKNQICNLVNCRNSPSSSVVVADSKEELSAEKIYEMVNEGVVSVIVKSGNTTKVVGSGFVVNSNGLIATNYHVVSGNRDYQIKIPSINKLFTPERIYKDKFNDIAIIKIDTVSLTSLNIGNSDGVKPGEKILTIGNPDGKSESIITSGIVSGVNRSLSITNSIFGGTKQFEDVFQIDAAVNSGNSGGPLLNKYGEVIGINFAKISSLNNLSFAIPSFYLNERIRELETSGRFRIPTLEIEFETTEIVSNNQIVKAAKVTSVFNRSELEVNDHILTVNGISLDEKVLSRQISEMNIGDEVELKIDRDGEVLNLNLIVKE